MFCGRCGADDDKTFIKSGFVETVDEVYYYRVGKCTQCGELLGTKEVYTFDHCEEMSREKAKELLTTEDKMQKMNKIIEMTIRYSAICKECKHHNCCFFAFDCLSEDYKNFQKTIDK